MGGRHVREFGVAFVDYVRFVSACMCALDRSRPSAKARRTKISVIAKTLLSLRNTRENSPAVPDPHYSNTLPTSDRRFIQGECIEGGMFFTGERAELALAVAASTALTVAANADETARIHV